jgi:HK97 family phage prohead protease
VNKEQLEMLKAILSHKKEQGQTELALIKTESGEDLGLITETKASPKEAKLSVEDYKLLLKECGGVSDGSDIEDELARKAYLKDLTADELAKVINKDRIVEIIGSDESKDRHGDKILVDGWDTKNFESNPVILLNHNSRELPVAKALKVWKHTTASGEKQLRFYLYFPEKDVSEQSDKVFKAIKAGLLSTSSVGFAYKSYEFARNEEHAKELGISFPYGVLIKEAELHELSIVTVPANANSLVVNSLSQKALADALQIKSELPNESFQTELVGLVDSLKNDVLEVKNLLTSLCQNIEKSLSLQEEKQTSPSEEPKSTEGENPPEGSQGETSSEQPKEVSKSLLSVLESLKSFDLNELLKK